MNGCIDHLISHPRGRGFLSQVRNFSCNMNLMSKFEKHSIFCLSANLPSFYSCHFDINLTAPGLQQFGLLVVYEMSPCSFTLTGLCLECPFPQHSPGFCPPTTLKVKHLLCGTFPSQERLPLCLSRCTAL